MEFSELNWFDTAVITIVFVSSLLAFFRGFLKALFSLITWIGSAIIAIYFAPETEEYVSNYMANEIATKITAYLILFIIAFIIFALITTKILFLIRSYRKTFFDKSLGLAFGFARGVLIVCLAFFSMSTFSKMIDYGEVEKDGKKRYGPEFLVEAKTYNLLNYSTEIILAMLPEGTQDYVIARVTDVKDKVIKSMTDEASKAALPRTLNDDEMKIMAKLRAAIPESEYEKIEKKYESKEGDLSELDKISIFRDILTSYNRSILNGDIKSEDAVSAKDVDLLANVLNGTEIKNKEMPEDEGTGYKELNIKQMDRLVDSVNEEE